MPQALTALYGIITLSKAPLDELEASPHSLGCRSQLSSAAQKLGNATDAIKHMLDPAPGSPKPKTNPLDFLPFGADVPAAAPEGSPKAPSMARSP